MKYTIMHVNDRAKENMDYNKKILTPFEYINDIIFFNGNEENSHDALNHIGIPLDCWEPYDGRSTPPLPGELGIWVSTTNIWKYIIDNKIDKFLILEDDITLKENFLDTLTDCLNDLPKDFDFLSLYYFEGQNFDTENTEIGSKNIKKSNEQYSAAQATVYSLKGAKKLLKLVKRKGVEYTADCFVFKQAQLSIVKGYSIKGDRDRLVIHDYKNIKSLIDPDGLRETKNL